MKKVNCIKAVFPHLWDERGRGDAVGCLYTSVFGGLVSQDALEEPEIAV